MVLVLVIHQYGNRLMSFSNEISLEECFMFNELVLAYVRWDVNGVLLSYGTVIRRMPIWFMVNLLQLKLWGCMNDLIGNIFFQKYCGRNES